MTQTRGSGQQVFGWARVGPGRVGSGLVFKLSRIGWGHPYTYPARPDPRGLTRPTNSSGSIRLLLILISEPIRWLKRGFWRNLPQKICPALSRDKKTMNNHLLQEKKHNAKGNITRIGHIHETFMIRVYKSENLWPPACSSSEARKYISKST